MIARQEQILRREQRHEKLMELISNYCLTEEEGEHLERVRKNTELEIANRFMKSKQNRNYVFPLSVEQEEGEIEQFPAKMSFQQTFYDLNNQNYLTRQTNQSTKNSASKIARRVKSLGSQKFDGKAVGQISKKLRQRPKQRQSSRQKLLFPPLISHTKSHRILSKIQLKPLSSNNSPLREEQRSRKISKFRENTSKQKSGQKIVQMLGAKLLTQGNNVITLGNKKIMVNSLNYIIQKQPLKTKRY